jgi:hypothetical protein
MSVPVDERDAVIRLRVSEKMPERRLVPTAEYDRNRPLSQQRSNTGGERGLVGLEISGDDNVAEIRGMLYEIRELPRVFRIRSKARERLANGRGSL